MGLDLRRGSSYFGWDVVDHIDQSSWGMNVRVYTGETCSRFLFKQLCLEYDGVFFKYMLCFNYNGQASAPFALSSVYKNYFSRILQINALMKTSVDEIQQFQ